MAPWYVSLISVSDQQNPCLSDSANPHDFNKTIAPRAQLQILQSQKLAGNVFFVTAYFSLWVQFKRRWLKFTVTEWSKLGFFWNCVAAKTSKVFSSSYTAPKVTATECYCFPLLEQGRWGGGGVSFVFLTIPPGSYGHNWDLIPPGQWFINKSIFLSSNLLKWVLHLLIYC